MDLKEARQKCGEWDEDIGCTDDYPDACPFSQECKEEAEKEE